jgi:dGTP triphosphohydrolase
VTVAIKLRLPSTASPRRVEIKAQHEREITMLKELTWVYVIDNAALATVQHGQQKVIRDLLAILLEEASPHGRRLVFPPIWRDYLETLDSSDDRGRKRVVVDFIAGMTEPEIQRLHQRLTGVAIGSFLEAAIGR